ncbi:Aflatoxin B1 aldehyde reductase member 2 [Pestalotiopsis sp. 9143b]|nr:Aflatoxin B1 aldehyde reductase member 2 [Pestalotiopsis sp. 9143b]
MLKEPGKVIFGGVVFDRTNGSFGTVEEIRTVLKALEDEGINTIDTAQVYGESEDLLGQVGAASSFVIDTKHCGGHIPGQSGKDVIVARARESLKKLRADHVNIFYLHSPDRNASLQETLAGVNELHESGMFKKFGLSNFLAHEVEDVVRVAKENNFVLPSVYQGNYSAIARKQETELIPVLRQHNISFYAYSPLAGGFLTKTREDIKAGEGRWDPGSTYGQINLAIFNNASMFQALDAWAAISEKWAISKADLAYRWVAYHSTLDDRFGDALIIGATKVVQLKRTMQGLRDGPLPSQVVDEINAVWDIVKDEAMLDPVNGIILKA